MELTFEKDYTITLNFYDKNDLLTPTAILDLSQDVSGVHAEKLGCGFDPFYSRGMIWVVVRNYIEVVKPIKSLKKVKLRTFALKPQFVEMPRDVEFIDENGDVLYKVRMIWMILDFKNNVICDPSLAGKINIESSGLFEKRIRKVPVIEKSLLTYVGDHEVKYSQLDHNNHMNNSKYLDLFLDIYGDLVDSIKNYQIEYTKQCYYKEKISLFTYNKDTSYYLFGYKDNELRFYVKAEI